MPDLQSIKAVIIRKGCFDPLENERIRDKFFSRMPATFIIPLAKYRLNEKSVLDVGCGYGPYLAHFGGGSCGFDISGRMVRFASAIGLRAVEGDIERDALPFGPYDAVWCSNLLEHVVSPHGVLRKFHGVLKDGGLLFLKVPLIPHPFLSWLYHCAVGRPGYLADEHLYAYSKKTIEFIVLRAGFRIIEIDCFWPASPLLHYIAGPLLSRFGTTVTVVAKQDPYFSYAEKRPIS
jgi:SAM-dependent methyltransferase